MRLRYQRERSLTLKTIPTPCRISCLLGTLCSLFCQQLLSLLRIAVLLDEHESNGTFRSQANEIPHLLVAPKVYLGPQLPAELQAAVDDTAADDHTEQDRTIYTNGTGDSRGWYEDGAYIALPDENEDEEDSSYWGHEEEPPAEALCEAYFDSLMERYQKLRTILNRPIPPNAKKQLDSKRPTEAAPFGRNSNTVKVWSGVLRNEDPHPLQVALMSKDSVLRVLSVMLGGRFLRRGEPLSERISHWLWALLARLPDQGELNYSEIGWIRDLGRRAVLLSRSLAEMAALREECAENGLGVNEGVDGSLSDEDVDPEDGAEQNDGEHSKEEADPIPNNAEQPHVADQSSGSDNKDDKEAAMDLESDADEGEVSDDNDKSAALVAAAKQRLLDQLETAAQVEEEQQRAKAERKEHLQMNTLATLCMILTVAGECYGQRDLLEFREPFAGQT